MKGVTEILEPSFEFPRQGKYKYDQECIASMTDSNGVTRAAVTNFSVINEELKDEGFIANFYNCSRRSAKEFR